MRIKIAILGSVGVVSCLFPSPILANPDGGSVVGGNASATISGEGTSLVTINQNQSRSIINWNSFSINAGEMTKFIQPSATAAVLNRVLAPNPSLLYGTLQANGRVFLVNPAGIMVGASGVVDTRGFLASTFDIGNSAFQAAAKLTFSGPSTAAVRNEGSIRALGGDVFLIANTVENRGTIEASGTVGLAAGSQITLAQIGEERITVQAGNSNTPGQGTGVNNLGQIQAATAELKAAGGNMYALAINNGGAVRATSFVNEGGRIFLRASGGNIQNSGTLSASSAIGQGGSVVVDGGHNAASPATVINSGTIEASSAVGQGGSASLLGDYVGLFDHGRIDVSGGSGGGTALIGGDYHGENPDIGNAARTVVGPDATITADAVRNGNGGKVVVWSDEATHFGGNISARGGAQGGDGGFVEVSSKGSLLFRGNVDLRAAHGSTGNLLLDPRNIIVSTNGTDPGTNFVGFATNAATDVTISPSGLSNQLSSANVTLQANNDIIYSNAVTSSASSNNLTNQAGRSIFFYADLSLGGGYYATVNDGGADPNNRQPGQAQFFMNPGTTLTARGGISVAAGTLAADSTGPTSVAANTGDFQLNNLFANGAAVTGNTAGRNGSAISVADNAAAGKNITVLGTIDSSGSSANGTGNHAGGAGADINLNASGSLSVGGLNTLGGDTVGNIAVGGKAGNITLQAGTGITLNGDIAAVGGLGNTTTGTGGTVTLNSGGGATQLAGAMLASNLLVLGSGSFSLTNSGNGVGLLAANVNGPFTYVNGVPLVVGTIGGIAGISNANNAINVSTVNGALIVTTNVYAGLSTVNLTAGSSGNENPLIITNGALVAGLGGVSLTADHLGVDPASSVSAGSNTVAIQPFDPGIVIRLGGADSTGNMGLSTAKLTNIFAGTLRIGSTASNFIAVVANLTFTNDLILQTGAGLGLTNNLNVAGFDVTFDHAGPLTGNGLVTAARLDLLGSGTVGALNAPLRSAAGTVALAKAGGDTFLTNSSALNLQGSTPGALSVSANGNITQTNALSVGGLLTLNAGVNDIVLTNAANNLSQVTATSADGSLVTSNNIALLNSVFNTNLTVAVPGNGVLSNVVVGNNLALTALAGSNTLTSVSIGGSGSVTNGGGVSLSLVSVGTNLLLQSGGDVTQAGAIRVSNNLAVVTTGSGVNVLLGNVTNLVAGSLLVTNSGGFVRDLALANSVSGAFTNLSFPTTLSNLTLTFPNSSVALGGVTVANNLSVQAGGDITQSNAISVGGTATLNASTNFNVTLSHPNNNFNVASLTASNATIADVDAIKLGASLVRSNLQVTAGGNISETGPLIVGGSSVFNFTANGMSLLLGSQANDFAGPVSVGGLLDTLDLRNVAANAAAPAGFTSATNVILTFDNSGITFGNALIQSNLTVTMGGDISQTNGTFLVVGGKAAFAATNFNITLTNAGNDFNVVSLIASNAAVADINTLRLDAPTLVTSNLTVSTVGDLSQNGALTVGGLTTLLATNANINLGNSGNDFRTVSLVASNATLADVNTLDLGTTVVTSNLTATAGTDLTQSGVVTVGGLASLNANRNITLANPNNDFNAISLIASNATVADVNSLLLGSSLITSNLTLTVGGGITNTGPVVVGGLASLLATNGSVYFYFPNTNNDFNSVLIVAQNANLWDLNGINLASAAITTNLFVVAGGDITQTGPLTVGGISGFGLTRDGASVLLGNQANNLAGLVEFDALPGVNIHDIQVRNVSTNAGVPLFFSGFSVTNLTLQYDNAGLVFGSPFVIISNLTAIVGGDIGQSNAAYLTVGGVATLWATNHNITLNSVSNVLNTVSLVGNNASLTDLNGLNFLASSVAGGLNVTAGGPISQSGPLFVGGSSVFNSPGSITLANAANDFVNQVTISTGQGANLVDANSLTVNGSSSSLSAHANGGDLTLAGYTTGALVAQASGNILQTGVLLVGTTANLDAGGNITLNNGANDFGGLVTVVNGQAVNLADVNTLTVGGASASLAARAFGGDLTLGSYTTSGSLTAQASANILQTGVLLIGTTTSLNAGANIALSNPANDFVGPVTVVQGQNVQLADVNSLTVGGNSANLNAQANGGDLTLAGYTTPGTLTALASGNILQTGVLLIGTTASLNAGGNITLNNAANDFVGPVTVIRGQNVQLTDVNSLTVGGGSANLNARANGGDLTLAGYTTTGTLTAQASGNIGQTTPVVVGTTSSLTAGGNITLNNAANDFVGLVTVVNGQAVNLVDANTLSVGGTSASLAARALAGDLTLAGYTTTGSLLAQASGNILQTAPVVAGTTSSLSAGGNITLNNAANDFVGPVTVLQGQTVQLTDVNGLTVGGNSTNLTAAANGGDLTLSGYRTLAGLTAQASGNILQTAPVIVGAASSLNAGGNITLNNSANDFVGPVTIVNGQAVNLADINGLTLGGTSSSLIARAFAGSLTLAGYTTTGALSAQATGDILQTAPLVVGTTSSLDAGGNILLNNANNDFGGLVTVVNGLAVSLADLNSFTVGGTSASLAAQALGGDLTLAGYTTTAALVAQASGNILQTAPLVVGTTSSLNAGGNITLNNAANDFAGLVTVLNGQVVQLTDLNSLTVGGASSSLTAHANAGDLTLVGYTTTGALAAQASGNILQTGVLLVGTTSSLNAGGNITLNNGANDFGGLVTVANGQAVNLADVNTLTVGGSSASLAARAFAGDLTLAGYSTTGALAAQASANILQTAPVVAGTASVLNAGGNITLNNAANDFVGPVTVVNGQAVQLTDLNSLTVGGTSANLIAQANSGDLTLAGYTTTAALSAQAGGNILQTAPIVAGTTSSLQAGGNITLNNAANDFVGPVTIVSGQAVQLTDINTLLVGGTSASLAALANGGDLTLAGYTTTGALAAQASGNILQTGVLVVGTTSSLNSGGNITLNNAANDFVGLVTVVNSQAVSLDDVNSLTVGGASASLAARAVAGDLTLAGYTTTGALVGQASGNILQIGVLVVGTTSSLDSGGNITLNNAANDFAGQVTVVNGQAVDLQDVNSLTVGGASASLAARAFAGDLTLAGYTTSGALVGQASGNILQTGPVVVGATSSLNAGGNITLNDPANDFGGAVTVVNGQVVNLVDLNALTVRGTSSSLTAHANAGDLTLAGYTTTGSLLGQSSGNILQTAPVVVGMTSSLSAGGNITLNNAANDFGGIVTVVNGQAVQLTDINALTVGGSSSSLHAVANGGDLALAGYTTSGNLAGQASGNIFQSGPLHVGSAADFKAGANIVLGDTGNTFGNIALASTNGTLVRVAQTNSMLLENVTATATNAMVVLSSATGSISQDAATTIAANGLAASAVTGISLPNNNSVQTLAGLVSGPGDFEFKDIGSLTVDTVGGVVGISATASGSKVTLDADRIAITSSGISAGQNSVLLQPVSATGTLMVAGPYAAPSTPLSYSGLNNVKAGTLQVGNNGAFSGDILIAQSIFLTNHSSPPFQPTPVSVSTNDTTALSLQTHGGSISNLLTAGSWAVVDVPRLSLVASNASFLGNLANSSDVSFLAWRTANPISFVDANTLDLLWADASKIGNNATPVDDHLNSAGFYYGIDSVFGPFPVNGNQILFNGGGNPAQQFANSLTPFNNVELPMTRLTLSAVSIDFNLKAYGAKIDALLPGAIWRSFAQMPFRPQVPMEDQVKPEAASKWVSGYLGISGGTGSPQQAAY